MKNIYTILDEIKFEDECKNIDSIVKNNQFDEFICRQILFSIIQKFYHSILLDELDKDKNEKIKNGT